MVLGVGVLISVLTGVLAGIAGSASSSINRGVDFATNALLPNALIEPNILIDLHRRKIITDNEYYKLSKQFGMRETIAKLFYRSQDSLLTPEQVMSYRVALSLELGYELSDGTITEAKYDERIIEILDRYYVLMRVIGYSKKNADDFFIGNRPFPTFSQQLEFLAKEVYEPESISTFKLDAEIPPELGRIFSYYGVPTPEARQYWISHWNPVQLGQWKDMFIRLNSQRTNIDEASIRSVGLDPANVRISPDDFNTYMKVLEYPQYHRDRLRATLYDPLPFTVIQQLYQYGQITDSQLQGYLEDYRYSPENARLVAETWKRKFAFEIRNPLNNNIIKQYENGRVSRSEAKSDLMTSGVDDDIAEYQLSLIDDKIYLRRKKWLVQTLVREVANSSLTDAQITTRLSSLISDAEERTFLLGEIKLQAARQFKRISFRQAVNAYGENAITEAQLRSILSEQQYAPSDISVAVAIGNAARASQTPES